MRFDVLRWLGKLAVRIPDERHGIFITLSNLVRGLPEEEKRRG